MPEALFFSIEFMFGAESSFLLGRIVEGGRASGVFMFCQWGRASGGGGGNEKWCDELQASRYLYLIGVAHFGKTNMILGKPHVRAFKPLRLLPSSSACPNLSESSGV